MSCRANLILLFLTCVLVLTGLGNPGPALARSNSSNEILFIFNHGSSTNVLTEVFNKNFGHDCYWLLNSRPHWVRHLDGKIIGGLRVRVETPCTGTVLGTSHDEDGCGGEIWVCKRIELILQTIEDAKKRGYPPERIFVGGHSAGGWASLLIKRWHPGLFNGVIVTAPAFEGKRSSRQCRHPICDVKPENGKKKDEVGKTWKNEMRRQHDTHLAMNAGQPPDLRALVMSFPCDPFGWNSELPFAGNDSVTSLTFPEDLSAKLQCAQAGKTQRYSPGGRKTVRCDEPEKTVPRDPGKPAVCGSGQSGDRSYAQVLNCPEHLAHLCALNQHTEVHRQLKFSDYMLSEDVVKAFIETHLDLELSRGAAPNGLPCDFIDQAKLCRRNDGGKQSSTKPGSGSNQSLP